MAGPQSKSREISLQKSFTPVLLCHCQGKEEDEVFVTKTSGWYARGRVPSQIAHFGKVCPGSNFSERNRAAPICIKLANKFARGCGSFSCTTLAKAVMHWGVCMPMTCTTQPRAPHK